MTILKTIIVDDEPLALKLLAAKLKKVPNVEVIAQCSNGREAINAVIELAPDLLFLDIQMPGLSGLDVVKQLQNDTMPLIVFATAYEQYALEAFDAYAVDYVLKPIDDERIQRAVDRALERFAIKSDEQSENKREVIGAIAHIDQKHDKTVTWMADESTHQDPQSVDIKNRKIVIKDRDEIHLLKQQDIQWIDAAGDYVCVHALGETHVKRCTLKEMLVELDETQFKRVHRSTIVNLDFIDKVIPHTKGEFFLMMGEYDKIKVSRNYKDVVKTFLTN
ncbi:LytR/AlgR family response regulator transcription factor [Brumicola nitratireducens]|uniref:LytTR family two component transcriptional regulator n=1 Tax=Glaciecola nitratireducens (strain JCM 12485 / KCTC 12276 / FR1064) TaxID=1085623 RepID=G4QE58_GLANF|nr:LytTR family DNA-binding domain-containing protein [Glaciecola nitratireducens]AEP31332.1 LytTR family two component transcriptional regulator [Glaciecola nitratireducens FR1064]